MIDFKQNWLRIVSFLLLFIGSILLIAIQVRLTNSATKLETSLLNLFQFFLSIGFTWLLSMVVFESSYKESQKKLAIAAFRRIKEIERNIERTQGYVSSAKKDGDKASECLEVVDFSLVNARDTIRSSISDWEDVIGEELAAADRIQDLVAEKNEISLNELPETKSETEAKEKIDHEITELKVKLPSAMRRNISRDDIERSQVEAVYDLGKTMLEKGCLELNGFWEPRGEFMASPESLSVGDTVYIARGMAGNRLGAIMAYDENQNSIGVITNRTRGPYDTFAKAMDTVFERRLIPKALGGEPLHGEIVEIEPVDTKSERQYFKVKVNRRLRNKVINEHPQLKEYNKKRQSDG